MHGIDVDPINTVQFSNNTGKNYFNLSLSNHQYLIINYYFKKHIHHGMGKH